MSMDTITGEMLLRAICEEPGDDVARLAYADWLEESGRHAPGGGFLRSGSVEWDAQVIREHVLGGYADEIPQPVRDLPGFPWPEHGVTVRSSRGFACYFSCPLACWLAHGPAICRAHPVERVELSDREPVQVSPSMWAWRVDRAMDANANPAVLRAAIPVCVFDLLQGGKLAGLSYMDYGSPELALSALSAACIAWAKQPR